MPTARWKPLLLVGVLVLVIPAVIAISRVGGSSSNQSTEGTRPRSVDERATLTSTDSTCYDAPATATPPPPGTGTSVRFTEATKAAGLCHVQHDYRIPPDCFFNQPTDVAGKNIDDTAALYTRCLPERMSGGVAIGDFDGDDRPDVYLTQLRKGAPGVLYRNNGDGTFKDATSSARLDAVTGNGNGATWVDIDNDGDRDLVVTTVGDQRYFLFVNNGDGTFREDAEARGAALRDSEPRVGFSVAAGDYDNDGFSDLFFTEWRSPIDWKASPSAHARLLHNRGAAAPGSFEDTTELAGVVLGVPSSVQIHPAYEPYLSKEAKNFYQTASFAASFADLDGDGWQDLLVVSDFGTSQLFWNNKDGKFTDGTRAAGAGKEGNGMGLAMADLDADGQLDMFITAIYDRRVPRRSATYTGNKAYQNLGGRTFDDATARWNLTDGDWGWGTAAADFDHNGYADIVMTNGQYTGMYHDILGDKDSVATRKRLWMNQGGGTFDEVAQAAGLRTTAEGKGLATFDADGDGDLDVLIANNGQHPSFYLNDSTGEARWVAVKVEAAKASTNADGFGAVVTVTDSTGRTQTQQVGVASAFIGQSDLTANFGLGAAAGPIQVSVTFPSTGERVTRNDVATNTVLKVGAER